MDTAPNTHAVTNLTNSPYPVLMSNGFSRTISAGEVVECSPHQSVLDNPSNFFTFKVLDEKAEAARVAALEAAAKAEAEAAAKAEAEALAQQKADAETAAAKAAEAEAEAKKKAADKK